MAWNRNLNTELALYKKCLHAISLFAGLSLFITSTASPWDNEKTHKDLSKIAASQSILSKTKGDYLIRLGFRKELLEQFRLNDVTRTVSDWFQEGAFLEDAGSNWDAMKGTARFNNHFHNPLKPWEAAGLHDVQNGESALLWAQDNANQQRYSESEGLAGDQTWQTIRLYYYNALTRKTDAERQEYFARTFKGLGHQIHLIQDMSVPAHVRNDAHPEDALVGRDSGGDLYFETWAKKNADKINLFAASPNFPQVDLTKNSGGFVPITQFYDTDQYKEGTTPSTSLAWGLSEYTNANFVSTDTIFTDNLSKDDKHYFPYPKYSSQCYLRFEEIYPRTKKPRVYFGKQCSDETIVHFVAVSPLYKHLSDSTTVQLLALKLDETTHYDYAQKLIPRAVGYSAGLLNYFFRGDIRLSYETGVTPGYVITNYSGEKMEGRFMLYYDNSAETRNPIWVGDGLLEAKTGDKANTFDFIPPSDAREPGKYILVFKGKMGNEDGAVAGYVFSRTLEITPPDQFVYAMADADPSDPYFSSIKAKVRNTNPSEAVQNGMIQAVAKYKADTDDADFIYSVSAPISVVSLSATSATELLFDFSNDPIPIDITDLYLQVIFKGKVGNDDNAVAVGLKDISEPTPVDLFNNTDLACINGAWYTAGSPEAIAQVDANGNKIADEWDVYPHEIRDIFMRFSSPLNPQHASADAYQFHVPSIGPGQSMRALYILTDHDYRYSFYQTWHKKSENDPWAEGPTESLHRGIALKNQKDYVSDPALCSSAPPCYVTEYPTYYTYRNWESWWGGSIIYIDNSYPPGSTCPGLLLKD
ncbi:MAG TPA: hypothetical protein VFG09_06105 [Thermodesulfovibrionales bacterium]|nr:hypothetical protein [Thermodesulfovibrionales bacterium]